MRSAHINIMRLHMQIDMTTIILQFVLTTLKLPLDNVNLLWDRYFLVSCLNI